ncbi:MAG: tripartite tricarboxylate transporter substrate binding protein [Betaproteobacteria bacterium]
MKSNKLISTSKRNFIKTSLAGGLFASAPEVFSETPWPLAKPIRLIIPFPPGNALDVIARLLQPRLSALIGQTVTIENTAGAAGRIGTLNIARANPDGYTLGGVQSGTLMVQPNTIKDCPYDPIKDFVPIAVTAWNYNVLVISTKTPFNDLQGLISWSKANPGKLTVGTNGEGGFPHLWFEDFRRKANITYTHVPYKGSTQMGTDLAAGEIMAGVDGNTGLLPFIQGNQIRVAAVTHRTRIEQYPNVPAIAEVIPGFQAGGWYGFAAPAKTPLVIANKLNALFNQAMLEPEFQARLPGLGLFGSTKTQAEYAEIFKVDFAHYEELVKSLGLYRKL